MKKKALQFLAGCLLFFGTSCYYDTAIEEEIDIPPPDQGISFEERILPILNSYTCTQCHNGDRAPDLRPENAYDALVPDFVVAGDADESVFFQRLPGKDHPSVGFSMTNSEIDLIEEGINRGAEE